MVLYFYPDGMFLFVHAVWIGYNEMNGFFLFIVCRDRNCFKIQSGDDYGKTSRCFFIFCTEKSNFCTKIMNSCSLYVLFLSIKGAFIHCFQLYCLAGCLYTCS